MGPAEIFIRAYLTKSGGARTWQLARRLGCPTPLVRRVMLRLERQGVVKRHERYSADNDIYWCLADARPSASEEAYRLADDMAVRG